MLSPHRRIKRCPPSLQLKQVEKAQRRCCLDRRERGNERDALSDATMSQFCVISLLTAVIVGAEKRKQTYDKTTFKGTSFTPIITNFCPIKVTGSAEAINKWRKRLRKSTWNELGDAHSLKTYGKLRNLEPYGALYYRISLPKRSVTETENIHKRVMFEKMQLLFLQF